MKIKAYHKSFEYTYTLGVFETIELLKNKPDLVLRVYIKSNSYKNKGIGIIDDLCKRNKIDLIESDNTINKLSKKDNCFAIAIIKKYSMELKNTNHVVLVNPGDMGNMGTIIRTMLGFGYNDLAIIRPGVDVFDPKVVRASMGAIFNINFEYFEDDLITAKLLKIYRRVIFGADVSDRATINSVEENDKVLGKYVVDYSFRKEMKHSLSNLQIKKSNNI